MNNKNKIAGILAALIIGFFLGNIFPYKNLNKANQEAGVIKIEGSEKTLFVDDQRVSVYPWLDTTSPTNISSIGATLNGLVNPNGENTDVWFYVFDANANNIIQQTSHISVGNGFNTLPFSQNISGLLPSTSYLYEICASTPSTGLTCASLEPLKTKRGAIPTGINHQ